SNRNRVRESIMNLVRSSRDSVPADRVNYRPARFAFHSPQKTSKLSCRRQGKREEESSESESKPAKSTRSVAVGVRLVRGGRAAKIYLLAKGHVGRGYSSWSTDRRCNIWRRGRRRRRYYSSATSSAGVCMVTNQIYKSA